MNQQSRKTIRNNNRAITAYRMRSEGATTNEICKALALKPHQVVSMVLLGERLENLNNEV